jgi:hypothetical protein
MDTTLLPSLTSLKEKSKVQAVEDHIENQQQIFQILKENLTMAQNRMKQQADQHHSETKTIQTDAPQAIQEG